MTSPLSPPAICREIIRLDAEVQAPPWDIQNFRDSAFSNVICCPEEFVLIDELCNETAELIAYFRNHSPTIARDYLKLAERTEKLETVVKAARKFNHIWDVGRSAIGLKEALAALDAQSEAGNEG